MEVNIQPHVSLLNIYSPHKRFEAIKACDVWVYMVVWCLCVFIWDTLYIKQLLYGSSLDVHTNTVLHGNDHLMQFIFRN